MKQQNSAGKRRIQRGSNAAVLLPRAAKCGFIDIPDGAPGHALLARYGPTVHVNIGFDEDFRPEADGPTPRPGMKPMLDPMRFPGTLNAESGGC